MTQRNDGTRPAADLWARDLTQEEGLIITSFSLLKLPRHIARRFGSIPPGSSLKAAKARFALVGIPGARMLMDALEEVETPFKVVTYFGFTLDTHKTMQAPFLEGDNPLKRLARLPRLEWGNREGTVTALGGLVRVSLNLQTVRLRLTEYANFSRAFEEAALFLDEDRRAGKV